MLITSIKEETRNRVCRTYISFELDQTRGKKQAYKISVSSGICSYGIEMISGKFYHRLFILYIFIILFVCLFCRKEGFVCNVKFTNMLPDIPFDAKFIAYPFEANRYTLSNINLVERGERPSLHNEAVWLLRRSTL